MERHDGLSRPEDPQADTLCAGIQDAGWVRQLRENIMALDNLHFAESGRAERVAKVCLQQTAGNSTGPQGNVVQGILR